MQNGAAGAAENSLFSFNPVYSRNILSKLFSVDSAKVNFCLAGVWFSWFSELIRFIKFQIDTQPCA